MKKILAISGSTRKHSSNSALLKHIADTYQKTLDMEIFEGIDQLPHFNPDLDAGKVPPSIREFREKIKAADGVLICTPEYVFSLPGSLKNAIEWSVSTTIFSNKPVAIIVASASGQKALESLELIMTTIESQIAEGSKLLIQGVKGKIGKNGKITDQKTKDEIERLMESLVSSISMKPGKVSN